MIVLGNNSIISLLERKIKLLWPLDLEILLNILNMLI